MGCRDVGSAQDEIDSWKRKQAVTAPVSSDLSALLDDLERAHAAATKGPWAQHPADLSYVIGDISDGGESYLDVADTAPSTSPGGWERAEANSAAIVAAVNAVPTLIAELRKRDAALRAVEALAENPDAFGPSVSVVSLREALTAALLPESVPS